jgi:hypothetical protein
MKKIISFITGWWSCVSWIFPALLEDCVDLKFWNFPTNIDDLLWYAERVNGRVAMLTLVSVLSIEIFTHESIWSLFGGL